MSFLATLNPKFYLDSISGHVHNEPLPVPLFLLTIDDMGFLINGYGQQLIWVPAHLRGGEIEVQANNVVIGGDNGAMTFIRFDPDSR